MQWMSGRGRITAVALAAGLALLVNCGGGKAPLRVLPPEPRPDAGAALGVTLSVDGPFEAANQPAVVLFARFASAARDAGALQHAAFVESNFTDGRHFYLLNAAPGTYAVAGARMTSKFRGAVPAREKRARPADSLETRLSFDFTQHTRHDEIWFAHDVIAATTVEVMPEAFAFAGDLQIKATKAISTGDSAQAILLGRRDDKAALSVSAPTIHREIYFGARTALRNDADAAARFRDATHLALGSAAWSAKLRAARDLRAVSGSRDAAPSSQPAPATGSLEELGAWLVGSFSSEAQAARDSAFLDIRLHIARIWPVGSSALWFYVEQASAKALEKPYRQRVYRLSQLPDGRYESAVLSLKSPLRFAGAWRDREPLATLTPDSLVERSGCAVLLRHDPDGFYRGGTHASDCPSELRGAAYATSEVTIGRDGMVTLDRGWDAGGRQVWGSTRGGYDFRRIPPAAGGGS